MHPFVLSLEVEEDLTSRYSYSHEGHMMVAKDHFGHVLEDLVHKQWTPKMCQLFANMYFLFFTCEFPVISSPVDRILITWGVWSNGISLLLTNCKLDSFQRGVSKITILFRYRIVSITISSLEISDYYQYVGWIFEILPA